MAVSHETYEAAKKLFRHVTDIQTARLNPTDPVVVDRLLALQAELLSTILTKEDIQTISKGEA